MSNHYTIISLVFSIPLIASRLLIFCYPNQVKWSIPESDWKWIINLSKNKNKNKTCMAIERPLTGTINVLYHTSTYGRRAAFIGNRNLSRIWVFNTFIIIGKHPNVSFSVLWLLFFPKQWCIFDIRVLEILRIHFFFHFIPATHKIKNFAFQTTCLAPLK